MVQNKLIDEDDTPLSAGIRKQDILVIVPKEQLVHQLSPGEGASPLSRYLYEQNRSATTRRSPLFVGKCNFYLKVAY